MCENIVERNARELLELRYSSLYANAVEFIRVGPFELIVKTQDGKAWLYDDSEGTVVNLEPDRLNISEESYRLQFGMRLKRLLMTKGISQQDLSNITGISTVMISHYINGKATPSGYNIDKIAMALGCEFTDLVYRY